MNLVIDIGNTRVKVALFERFKIEYQTVFLKEEILEKISEIKEKHQIDAAIISSVGGLSSEKIKKIKKLVPLVELNHKTQLPFENKYKTPKTLGVDRIALIAAAVEFHKNTSVLVIDAGTCVTFDYVNAKNEYFGGAISPGIKMRYKALNTFTASLPLLEADYPNDLIGNTTENSIHSGIVNGMIAEIDGVIDQYKLREENLTIVLTGGDTYFLAKRLKNSIFANPNFLLEGLNNILNYNISND